MFRGLISFLVGVYTGLYVCQNYEVPKVDDPSAIIKKIRDFADQHKKD